jgi:hypothetical protein
MKRDRVAFPFGAGESPISPGHEVIVSPWNDFSVDMLRNVTKSDVTAFRYAFRTLFQFGGLGEKFDRNAPNNSECFHKKLYY